MYHLLMKLPLESVDLFRGETFTLRDVVCRHGRGSAGDEERTPEFGIGFPLAGVFRKHGHRAEVLADANHAILWNRGETYRISHPVDGGDTTTLLSFPPSVVTDAVARRAPRDAGKPAFPVPLVPASPAAYALMHRLRRLARAPGGRELELEESSLAILDSAIAVSRGAPTKLGASLARRRRADAVRELLAARLGLRVTLSEIGREVGVSPFHLAREFRDETGIPIHRYLNRLRLRVALARVSRDGRGLTAIALESGFSSHAHFTDAFRREFGAAPSSFRLPASRGELAQLRKILEV